MSDHIASINLASAEQPVSMDEAGAQAVRLEIEQMMSHAEFDASARNRRFLKYVVEETLNGRAARIKAYSIALAVFDRGEDFDPLTDPIVRIEASRLRRAIEHYYLTVGRNDRIRVDMPKGSYVPTFTLVQNETLQPALPKPGGDESSLPAGLPRAAAVPAWHGRWFIIGAAAAFLLAAIAAAYVAGRYQGAMLTADIAAPRNPSILVLPFQSVSTDDSHAYIASGMTHEIIAQLTRFEEFFVFGPQQPGADPGAGSGAHAPAADFVMAGSVQISGDLIRVNVVLTEQATGQSLWSWSREESLSASGVMEITNSVSQRVVNLLAQPDGVILEQFHREIARKPATALSSYECVVAFRTYWRSYDRAQFDETLACLERTVVADPTYAPAFSSLALMNVDRHRFGFGGGDPDGAALARAADLARSAMELEPRASQSYLALSLALWFQHRVADSIATAERGLTFNPNNAELMADLGLRHALLGQWDKALALTNQAYERDPAAPTGYRVVHFLNAYIAGDYDQALLEAERIGASAVTYGHIARAAALGQLGREAEAASAIADLLRIDPNYGAKVRTDLAKRNMAPHIIEAIADGLHKAGLRI